MFNSTRAAQAILDAAYHLPLQSGQPNMAAALELLADQVAPESQPTDREEWLGQSAWLQAQQCVRRKILAIAAELRRGSSQPPLTLNPQPHESNHPRRPRRPRP